MDESSWRRKACAVFLFLAAVAVPSHAQTFTTLATLDDPHPFLVQGTDGNFYGTTESGGAYQSGTVFKMTPEGTLTTLYSFGSTSTDGVNPFGGLIQADDGNFYGTTEGGGATSQGTVFRITPGGTETTLHSFDFTDGIDSEGPLVQGTDGNLYGTTAGGGVNRAGTVFKITTGGTFTTLYSFVSPNGEGLIGAHDGLIQGADGYFYGTTESGGTNNDGTVFKITPEGTLTTLYSFGSTSTDGISPLSRLVQGTDGNFYGTTTRGGTQHNCGTVFKITTSGTETTLHSFAVGSNPTDGCGPAHALIQATDGNLYGTTAGTIFKITLEGILTTLYTTTGSETYAFSIIQGGNGDLYGIAANSGLSLVFSLTLPAAPLPAPSITQGGVVPVFSTATTIQPGSFISIYGANLAAAFTQSNGNFPTILGNTSVTIDGKLGYLYFVSSTQINLQAPDDTATGTVPVVVTTANGRASSTVTLGTFGPSFSLLGDAKNHVAGIILRGGGMYDIIGPTGNSLGYPTVAATAGDTIELFGVGFGPTSPSFPAGQVLPTGAYGTATNPIQIVINGTTLVPAFAGISEAGLFQFNLTLPSGLGTGDVSLVGDVGGVQTQSGVVIALQ